MPERREPPRATWRFLGRTVARSLGDETRRLARGLEGALRAGHGAGVRFRLTIPGGAWGPLLLDVPDPASERWVERALVRAYGPGDWRRTPSQTPLPALHRWIGRRRAAPRDGARTPSDVGEVAHALAAALRSVGGGATLAVAFRAVVPSRLSLLDFWPRADVPPLRPLLGRRPAPRTAGPPTPGDIPPVPGLTWSASLELSVERGVGRSARMALIAAVSSAWTGLDGHALELSPRPPDSVPRYGILLSESEVPALLPGFDLALEPFDSGPSGDAGIPLGRTGSGALASLPVEAGEGRHFALLGETGMGKSSLLVAIARRASHRGALVVLDPLGETAEAVRETLKREARPLWVAPEALGVEANALATIALAFRAGPVQGSREVETLVHALRRVRAGRYTDSAFWGPRLEEMLGRAVRAAAALPGGTLEDAHALLASAGSARTVVAPEAQAEVRELAARVRDRPEDAEGARRLLYEIVRNPTLSRMLCAREPRLDLADAISGRRPLLISGAAARVGESTARYLLATYLALVWSVLLARGHGPKTFVLLDEAQWFAHEGLGEMLRLARRDNVHVGLATQSLLSLPADVREAVRTNVADLVVFRGSAEEAHEIARTNPAVSATGLLGLARGEAAVLVGKGERVRWVRTARWPAGSTLGPPSDPRAGPEETGSGFATPPGRPEEEGSGWAELVRRASRLGPGELLAVDVSELRPPGPGGESALRRLGGTLGRRGAIVRTERRDGRTTWWLRPELLVSPADRSQAGRGGISPK
jgi:energy-coupling factor transporter ATP-binding protein EcfA2